MNEFSDHNSSEDAGSRPSREVLAELHRLALERLYHEDNRLSARFFNFLTAQAILIAALSAILATFNASDRLSSQGLAGFETLICTAGYLLAVMNLPFGYTTLVSINYWRQYIRLLEQEMGIPFNERMNEFLFGSRRTRDTAVTLGPLLPDDSIVYEPHRWFPVPKLLRLVFPHAASTGIRNALWSPFGLSAIWWLVVAPNLPQPIPYALEGSICGVVIMGYVIVQYSGTVRAKRKGRLNK